MLLNFHSRNFFCQILFFSFVFSNFSPKILVLDLIFLKFHWKDVSKFFPIVFFIFVSYLFIYFLYFCVYSFYFNYTHVGFCVCVWLAGCIGECVGFGAGLLCHQFMLRIAMEPSFTSVRNRSYGTLLTVARKLDLPKNRQVATQWSQGHRRRIKKNTRPDVVWPPRKHSN